MTTITDADKRRADTWLDRPSDTPARRSERDRLAHKFARHREQEVAKIVAYLKKRWPIQNYGDDWPVTFAINAIEAGEYRNDA